MLPHLALHCIEQLLRNPAAKPIRKHGHAAQVAFTIADGLIADCPSDGALRIDSDEYDHLGQTPLNRFRREHRVGERQRCIAIAVGLEGQPEAVEHARRIVGRCSTDRNDLSGHHA